MRNDLTDCFAMRPNARRNIDKTGDPDNIGSLRRVFVQMNFE